MECKQDKKPHKNCSFKYEKDQSTDTPVAPCTKPYNAFLKHCPNTVLFIPLCSCSYSACIFLVLSLKS